MEVCLTFSGALMTCTGTLPSLVVMTCCLWFVIATCHIRATFVICPPCVLYYCHRVSTQFQLTNISYPRDFCVEVVSLRYVDIMLAVSVIFQCFAQHCCGMSAFLYLSFQVNVHFRLTDFVRAAAVPAIIQFPLPCNSR